MTQKLEEFRKKIDSIDNQVHDLLMERASLVSGIAAEKKKNKMPTVQPAREAMMLRRLLARHQGPLPEATIIHIWRELVGAVSLLQTGLNVVVSTDEGGDKTWDMARNYFGSVLPMKRISNPLAAIGAVRDGGASFAVLPWPENADSNPWWAHMLSRAGDRMRICVSLPYGSEESPPPVRALVVSKLDFKPSGDDHSFLAMELTESISRGFIVDTFKKLEIEPLSLYTKSGGIHGGDSLHLIEVDTFIDDESPVLAQIRESFGDYCSYCVALGGYPAVPVFKKRKAQKIDEALPVAPKRKKREPSQKNKRKTAKS